ncbi:ABC transporter ATP-binding protein [Pararhodospirillum photometricum]|uniref:ABC transporter ATP-binding protein n=1 Tax=Pararhodospirillum photometricum TaxID=1084 RepID=UPI0002DF013C|nr:ABC transporter ATP-binding protein [Pararhodospirillum photometricum]
MLHIDNVEACHGPAQVLFGLSLAVGPGEGVALLGRNGAGKSATFLAVLGLIRVTAGDIRLHGQSVLGRPLHTLARAGLGWVPEERRVFTGLSVAENIRVGMSGRPGPWSEARLQALFPALAPLWRRPAGLLSGGEQQMLSVARTLAGNPDVLLLDEPSEGLAPIVVQALAEAVAAIKAEGVAVLLSEQNPLFAEPLADRLVLIERGRAVWTGSAQALAAETELRERVLLG